MSVEIKRTELVQDYLDEVEQDWDEMYGDDDCVVAL